MAGEGGAASECLLAISVGAFVGTLSRMSPAMSGKRAAVAEGLCASLTVVRLLSGMHTLVHSQGRSLNELLSTLGPVANMGSNSAVNALVASKITASSESLATGTARISLDGLLRRRRGLLRHLLHVHVRHASHVGHLGIALHCHGGGHRVRHMHRRLHRGWRWVGSGDTVRVGVLRVLRAVRRG